MIPVLAIAYAVHNRPFLRELSASGAPVYSLTKEGELKTLQGKPAGAIAALSAQHVVWVGVPSKWVKKLGPMKFKSHFVGKTRPGRWVRMADPKAALAEIQSAYSQLEKERKAVEKAKEGAVQQARERARIAALHAPPPLYIPQELR